MAAQPPDDPDDPPDADWFATRTEVDAPRLPPPVQGARQPVTAPHPIAGDVAQAFENGRREGFEQGYNEGHADGKRLGQTLGQDDAIGALMEVFADSPGGIDSAARHTALRVRKKLTKP